MTLHVRLRASAFFAALTCLLAAGALAVPLADGATPPDELNFSAQKAFSLGGAHVSVDEVPIVGAEETEKASVVGSISNGNGDIADVTLDEGKVSVGPVEAPGKYSGSVDLNSENTENPLTKISFSVRDNWGWAAITLIVGLLIALLGELWLTRWRPRGQLRKAFVRLGERLAATAEQQTVKLGEVGTGWIAPRIHGPGSMLAQFKERIETGLANATSDAERERFGPGGEEMKKVDIALERYEELLGYSRQIAQRYRLLAKRLEPESLQSEFVTGALAQRIGALLAARTIAGAAELTEMLTEAKDVYLVLHGVSRLDLSYRLLAAKAGASTDVKDKITMRRKQLLHSDASTDDLTAQHTIYVEIAKKLYEIEGPKTVEVTVPLLASIAVGGATVPAPMETPASHPSTPLPEAAPVVSTGTEKEGTAWSKYLDMGNWAFTIISSALVFLAGLSALYFSNATFGSVGDYLGMFLWGSTVQGGISLVRQVVPGAAKGLAAGK
jgi:hypothetical protein